MVAIFVAVGTTIETQCELNTRPLAEPQYLNSLYAVDSDGKRIELEH